MATPGPLAELFGRLAYAFSKIQPHLPTETLLLVTAVLPIYAGAHASLFRPSSAAKPDKRNKDKEAEEDEDDYEEEAIKQMEGLSPSDAIMLPVLAGVTLAGLYFLIKWMQDPALLSKILNWYFSLFGVLSVSKLIRDTLGVIYSFIFPDRYAEGGVVYKIDRKRRMAVAVGSQAGKETARSSPLPGLLSRLPFGISMTENLWTIRDMPKKRLTFRLYIWRLLSAKAFLGPLGAASGLLATMAVLYFNLVDKPWWLTNLMGLGFAYGALQLMSPTTFATGTLVLVALFFYDIYFVFFTPMMVTVAKSLDIPIKLIFPRFNLTEEEASAPDAKRFAMLGLGDVVLPGIMMGLALRFDLYLFYLRKQVKREASDQNEMKTSDKSDLSKAKYVSVSNRWGERFWLWQYQSLSSAVDNQNAENLDIEAITFPKRYFYVTVFGYVLGMLVTLTVMHVAEHAQPALLYLVPGVLGSLWGTAWLRGEWKEMWEYSEATEDNEDDKNKKKDSKDALKNKSIFSMEKRKENSQRLEDAMQKYIQQDTSTSNEQSGEEVTSKSVDESWEDVLKSSPGSTEEKSEKGESSSNNRDRELLAFSIILPPSRSKQQSKPQNDKRATPESDAPHKGDSLSKDGLMSGNGPKWKAPAKAGEEPVGKRQRTA